MIWIITKRFIKDDVYVEGTLEYDDKNKGELDVTKANAYVTKLIEDSNAANEGAIYSMQPQSPQG